MKTIYLIIVILTSCALAVEKEAAMMDYTMRHEKFVESIYGIRLCPELIPFLNLNKKDAEYAAQLTPEILNRLKEYVSTPRFSNSKIDKARKVGDFILIFYTQEELADGGFELVYSLKEEKVLGNFSGDYRG